VTDADNGLPPQLDLGRPPAPAAVQLPAWLRRTRGEHRWPAALAVLVLIVLQLVLPQRLAFQPRWLLPVIESLLFVVLVIANPTRIDRESRLLRMLGLALVAVVSVATAWSAALLVGELIGGRDWNGIQLLKYGAAIWLTNVLTFALWYWELDRGGPAARANARQTRPDFLFTAMTVPELAGRDWEPTFVDYLYLSFTNATAFSPTDTMPLSSWAKLSMLVQAAVSLATFGLIVARAVNVLA
jgi:hypothetical protein